MAITGSLAEFSLPELLRFIAQRQGTGLLSIHIPSASPDRKQLFCIWLHKGLIVAAANRLDSKGLPTLISQRGWLSYQEISWQMSRSSCAVNTPIGLCLHRVGAISAEQLKLLFIVQVLHPVCALFKLAQGRFVFDTTAALPKAEMTGLSVPAPTVLLLGLRVLRDWKPLEDKMPDPSLVVSQVVVGKPQLQMDSQEGQVWALMNGDRSLQAIAKQLDLPTRIVQQIAFRLSLVDLIEEVPIPVSAVVRPAKAVVDAVDRWSFSNLMELRGMSLFRPKVS